MTITILGMTMGGGNHGSDEAGFAYDWTRQRQNANLEAKHKNKALKKKIDKLTKKNRNLRQK